MSNPLKQRLLAGEVCHGCWQFLRDPLTTELLGEIGFDFILIDHEHGTGDLGLLTDQLLAAKAAGVPVVLRVPSHNRSYIRRALDLGVSSIMVPKVDGPGDARKLAAACRYPPLGKRGTAHPIIRATRYGLDAEGYLERAHEDLLLIVQIESVAGARAAGEIAEIDGIDMAFIGPFDLSCDAGKPGRTDDPGVVSLIRDTEKAVTKAGKLLGTIPRAGADIAAITTDGHRLLPVTSDIHLLRDGGRAELARLRSESPATRDGF